LILFTLTRIIKMKIFIGSSSEAKKIDNEVRKIIENYPDADPKPWRDVFIPGEFGLESLARVKKEVDGAILITTVDDKIWYRGSEAFSPRDNVLFELGLFIGELGRDKVALIVVKDKNGNTPKIPTDLAGLNYLYFQEGKNASNEDLINNWLKQLQRKVGSGNSNISNPFEVLKDQFPKLPENWKDDVKNYILEPFRRQSLDALRGEFTLNVSQYYTSLFASINNAESDTEIKAISLLSEEFWEEDPFQAQYLRHNIEARKRNVSIKRLFVVSRELHSGLWKTIQKQLDNGIEIRVINSKIFSRFIHLEDMVLLISDDDKRGYISNPIFSNSSKIRSANLNLNINYCQQLNTEFDSLWEIATFPKPSFIDKKLVSKEPPGNTMEVFSLTKDVISCEEAAEARGVPLKNELKTLILSTTNGFVAVHIPGDGKISLRSIKNALGINKAHIAAPEELYKMELSPGTVSAILEPVWSLPHLISKRVLAQDYVTTNNGTRRQYYKFDPIILLDSADYIMGHFDVYEIIAPFGMLRFIY